MRRTHLFHLTSDERAELEALTKDTKVSAKKVLKSRAMLLADESAPQGSWSDPEITEAIGLSASTLQRLRQRICEVGPLEALEPKRRMTPAVRALLDGEKEARLIALACSHAPDGYRRWTLRLLAKQLIKLEIVDSISHETVRQSLKKNKIKPWRKTCWCIPPKGDAVFVAAMEDILDVYQRPEDPRFPVVCLDEFSKQLLGESRQPIPGASGRPERYDSEYIRKGSATAFLIYAPFVGTREILISEGGRRTAQDYAHVIEHLVEEMFPEAEKIILVEDNLNTHRDASLYQTFTPEKAHNLARKIERHHTPKHGSWLNIAESEIAAITKTTLPDRVGSLEEFRRLCELGKERRNQAKLITQWRFTTKDARIKLARLYPSN